ncbi:MAG: cytochrome c [Candidatus Acidiferrales bacterium]
MIAKRTLLLVSTAILAGAVTWTGAQEKPAPPRQNSVLVSPAKPSTSASAVLPGSNPAVQSKPPAKIDASERLEGEKRFRANCGRCHAAPHKFPPRMMATIVRHMRVRATITDEDMRLILEYMTQ